MTLVETRPQAKLTFPSGWDLPSFEEVRLTPEGPARTTRYCIVVPVINEGQKLITQLRGMGASGFADIIIADGGSTDGSTDPQLLAELGCHALLIKTSPGGQSTQLRMAFAWALANGYEGIVGIDGNGKDGWEAIPLFMDALDRGVGFVQGSRYVPGGEAVNTPLDRHLAVRLVHAPLISLSAGHWYTDTTNGFRGYSAALLRDQRVAPFRDIFVTYNLHYYLAIRAAKLGYRIEEVPVRRAYPEAGKVPTKIGGLKGRIEILRLLADACLHRYDPVDLGELK